MSWQTRGLLARPAALGAAVARRLRRRAPHDSVEAATTEYYADASFDVVFSSNLLHHLDRPTRAVAELARVARRAVVVVEPSAHNLPLWLAAHFVPHERQARRFTRAHVEALLRSAPLRVERHCFAGGMVLPNRTREAALPYLFANSTRRALCMTQIFVCSPRGAAAGA